MTARDVFGHTYVSKEGAVSSKRMDDCLFDYYCTRNDGWTYQRKGPEGKIYISVFGSEPKELEKALDIAKNNIDKQVYNCLMTKIKNGSTIVLL